VFEKTSFEKIDISKVRMVPMQVIMTCCINAMVRATVKDGKLVNLDLLEHRFNHNYDGSAVIQQILQKQSLDVDGVSGATYSYKSIIKATERALKIGLE
jgi:uncharacterized protein with FMN-binding domain